MSSVVATNKKAFRDYFFSEKWECGIELKGGEVKSIRAGNVNFTDTFARVEGNEAFLYNLHIEPYRQASYLNEEPGRVRKLLLHKREIQKIHGIIAQKGLALIPTKIYKRETIKKRDIDRDLRRTLRTKR